MEHSGNIPTFNIPGTFLREYSPEFHSERFRNIPGIYHGNVPRIFHEHIFARWDTFYGYQSVKAGKKTEGIKPRIRYLCDTSKSFIYYTTRDEENKFNTPMSRDAKRSNQNP